MKKIISLLILIVISSSCQEDLEVWNSTTFDYNGRYVYRLLDENGEVLKDYSTDEGHTFWIYNVSDDIEEMVWFDDLNLFKTKVNLTGDVSSFKSSSLDFSKLTNNLYVTDINEEDEIPTAENLKYEKESDFIKVAVEEGKIMKGKAVSIGGNVCDSIYVKFKTFSGTAIYESVLKPEDLWNLPDNPEYIWKMKEITRNEVNDNVYIISGYRYTGYPEDEIE